MRYKVNYRVISLFFDKSDYICTHNFSSILIWTNTSIASKLCLLKRNEGGSGLLRN